VTHDYQSVTWENSAVSTVGSLTVNNYRVIDGDDIHPYTEGWEWRLADIDLRFLDGAAWELGWRYYYIYAIDGYDFGLDHEVTEGDDGTSTIIWEGEEYEIFSTVDMETTDNGEYYYSVGQWAVHVPIGYDGALLAFVNPGNVTDADNQTMSELIDADTVWFRMN